MVQRCCVPFCDTRVGDVDPNGSKVRFHRIPLLPAEKYLRWRDQITDKGKYKPDPELTVNSRICSKHFLAEDYITMEAQKPGTAGNHVLAKDAIPSIFQWNDEHQAQLSRAAPFMKKAELQSILDSLNVRHKNQEVQCCLGEECFERELGRKNIIIRQLLQKLAELEGTVEEKEINPTAQPVEKEQDVEDLPLEAPQEIEITSPPDSPEMPKLTPSVPAIIDSLENDLIQEEDNYYDSISIIPPPSLALETCQNCQSKVLRTSNTSVSICTQTDELEQVQTQTAYHVSVIKRVGKTGNHFSDTMKPPKKRKLLITNDF